MADQKKVQKGYKIIIAGGGTGGHIFPAVAIANALKKLNSNTEILFVGARGKMEMEKIPQAGYRIKGLDIAGFNRSSLIKNIGLPWKLVKSFLQVRNIFNEFKPDAVVGVGGYSSFPVLHYAQAKRIPSFIHESNSFAGKSNMMLAKNATKVFVATDGMQKFFQQQKIVIAGNPIRSDIAAVDKVSKKDALEYFGFHEGKTSVLAVGGSLGARSINEAIAKHLDAFENNNLQLIWQTGKTDSQKWKEIAQGKSNLWVNEFITQMNMAYAAADIVISRAGAMAIAELCVVQKPVLFVPFPFAAEDHQTVNAQHLVERGAALSIKDSEALDKVVPMIVELAKSKETQQALKDNISKYGVLDADRQIANQILESIK
ncbi:MAG: undecaprenyldiphospho-muramoylpentapeptide beta-N-acetylglucosaminyltransferase [Bacteroidota bacterium]|nr:undecaprenyldiphospho-muramoylpentapeptide beta-N-acetylglucosaminyltransferase [Bacteroidota bacterium]